LAVAFLAKQPKAKLYIGFADFSLVRFTPLSAQMNGGFGKAYLLHAEDLAAAMR
jgi:putative heme iron utilization protein